MFSAKTIDYEQSSLSVAWFSLSMFFLFRQLARCFLYKFLPRECIMWFLPNFGFLAGNKTAKRVFVILSSVALLIVLTGFALITYISKNYPDSQILIVLIALLVTGQATFLYLTAMWINEKIHWYEEMLDVLPFPISVTDKNMNWTFINKVVEDLQKVKRKDIVGKHCSNWGAAICGTQNCGITCLGRGEDHTFFDQWGLNFKVDTRYLHDLHGNIIGHIEAVSDITFLKKAQNEQTNLILNMEEISNKFAKISSEVTKEANDNVQATSQTATMVNQIKDSAEKCSQYMEKMTHAMLEINNASRDIVNVTKTISDIASRTNILAINASIESARAGEAGKGFAVVAKEVKSLASQSAKSVNDTRELINNSMAKAELGMSLVKDTADYLAKIVEGINTSNELIGGISSSSETQKVRIADINDGARQMVRLLEKDQQKLLG
jgi:PAS domain-containing protein